MTWPVAVAYAMEWQIVAAYGLVMVLPWASYLELAPYLPMHQGVMVVHVLHRPFLSYAGLLTDPSGSEPSLPALSQVTLLEENSSQFPGRFKRKSRNDGRDSRPERCSEDLPP